jgi:hypothetical protein
MSEIIRCSNCGAVMQALPDGRVHGCSYCGAQQRLAIDSADVAAGLALDLHNIEAFVRQLASALHGQLGSRTQLHEAGGAIQKFEINLDPDVFLIKREGHALVAQHKKLVRGVALKTNTHPLDRWVELLSRALAAHANENARVAQVLASIRR